MVQNSVEAQKSLSISQRLAIIEERSRIGCWEGGTIIGKDRKGVILKLVERKTRH